MDKPKTRLDTRKHRKQLRDIGSLRRSNLPEKVKNRLRIVSWYGRRKAEDICRFFEIRQVWKTVFRGGDEGVTGGLGPASARSV